MMTRNASSLAAIAGTAVMALGLSACGKSAYKQETLSFTERDTNINGFNDAPPKAKLGKQGPDKLTPGDTVTFAADLLDSSKNPVGALNAQCTATRPGTFDTFSAHCAATATLPKGKLELGVGGQFGPGGVSGAIVGGTGAYAGAGGSFKSTTSNGPGKDTFNIQIPRK